MTPVRTVVLDNEAVQALGSVSHRKHRAVLAVLEAVASRNARRAGAVALLVPTAVRVEAGWDRRSAQGAVLGRLRAADVVLDRDSADRAAEIVAALGVSVADAHLGATLASSPGPHAVVTSDAGDARRVAGHLGLDPGIVVV